MTSGKSKAYVVIHSVGGVVKTSYLSECKGAK
nr:MAG TPA: hypothetical protein [Caudoviricetes sp.]